MCGWYSDISRYKGWADLVGFKMGKFLQCFWVLGKMIIFGGNEIFMSDSFYWGMGGSGTVLLNQTIFDGFILFLKSTGTCNCIL